MNKILVLMIIVAAMIAGGFAQSEDPNINNISAEEFAKNADVDDVIAHLQALKDISVETGDNREAGTNGFDLSSHYVAMQLLAAGYDVRMQPFPFDKFSVVNPSVFAQEAPKKVIYEEEKDFNTMTYSPSGNVKGLTQAVDLELGEGNSSTSGCEIEDFDGFPKDYVAVIQRGACSFLQKAQNAAKAGASGAIIFNQGNDEGRKELFNGTLSKNNVGIPVFSVSYDLGLELAKAGTIVSLVADTKSETILTHNVLAETKSGNPDNVIMIGSHLDSVGAGPGINDNGTGSAAILDVALRIANLEVNNKVRFAWWGAEEHGLVGSRFYTANLTEEEVGQIALYLNFDMIGSPNYIFGIYDADGSTFEVPGPKGSAAIEKLFHDYFNVNGHNTIEVQANGRSDYVGFAERGIPFGGSFTGAEVAKTPEQVLLFGGTEGESYDACYHKDCDTMENINRTALEMNHRMITYAAISYARSTEDVDKEKSGQDVLPMGVFRSNSKPQFDPNAYPEYFKCHTDISVWAN